jgi:hypothetical protein
MSKQLDFWDVMSDIDRDLQRLNWDETKGRAYLKATYGTHTRFRLTDTQLLEFRSYLSHLPNSNSNLPVASKLRLRKIGFN